MNFRPLGAEIAEKIARREVARVLERSGLARRRLAVDVEPAVFALLLREGYSPAFGARPLKRTVERLVLLPVARSIAAGEVPFGSVLRLCVRGNHVAVEVMPPVVEEDKETRRQGDKETGTKPGPAEGRVPGQRPIVGGASRGAGRADCRAACRRPSRWRPTSRSWSPGPSAADFWDDRAAACGVQDEIFRLDGVLPRSPAWNGQFATRPRSSVRTVPYPPDLAQVEERLESLESRVRHAAFLVACRNVRDLGDAFVSLTLVASRGEGLDAVGKLRGCT